MKKNKWEEICLRLVWAAMFVVPFISAGRYDIIRIWVYVAIFVILGFVGRFVIDKDLYKERLCPAGTDQDRLSRCLILPLVVGHLVLASLDVGRLHLSDFVPHSVCVVGAMGMAVGFSFSLWAMHVNKFFSRAVRVQQERGHQVITCGPYKYIRHPGYTGMIAGFFFGGLLLGSLLALVPILGLAVVIIWRTMLEDKLLERELTGYADYAQKVRFRLVPGIW